MSNIEDDLKVLEKFMNNEMQRDKLERDIRCGGWKMGDIYKHLELNPAIKHILSERKQDKERIKELESKLEEANKQLDLDYVDENYIPKQKVKEMQAKIKELEEELYSANKIINEYLDGIPKQVIKDKIDEINREEQELQKSISEEEREEYADANISYLLCDFEIRKEVLRELMEDK